MEFEESIYNLIPKEAYVPPKPQRHVSKHNPLSAPTSSTFCLKTTSKPKISNISGDDAAVRGHHTNKSQSATLGLPKGAAKPDANTFRLKNTGTFKLPDGKNHSLFFKTDISTSNIINCFSLIIGFLELIIQYLS